MEAQQPEYWLTFMNKDLKKNKLIIIIMKFINDIKNRLYFN